MGEFLHVSDKPLTIEVLLAVRSGRDWDAIGCTPEPNGLSVDWDLLEGSYLPSTEKATIRLARAASTVEGRGGLPHRVHHAVRALLEDLTPGGEP